MTTSMLARYVPRAIRPVLVLALLAGAVLLLAAA